MEKPEGLLAIGAISGSLLSEAIRFLGRRQKRTMDDASSIRKELRDEIHQRVERERTLQTELDQWRERYYSLSQEMMQLRTELTLVKKELEQLRRGFQPA